MTMPVFALLTPVALPQGGIGGQSALTDYSDGQQQSYSEDLASLLAGMETALSQLDNELQQLSEGTAADLMDHGQVQSLSQSLVLAPLLVESDAVLINTTTLPSLMTSDLLAVQAEGATEWLPLSLSVLSSSAGTVSSQNPLPAAGLLQPQQSSALSAPLIVPATLPQQQVSDAASVQAALPKVLTESQDLWSALKPSQQNTQNTAVATVAAATINSAQKKVVFDDPHAGVGGLQEAEVTRVRTLRGGWRWALVAATAATIPAGCLSPS